MGVGRFIWDCRQMNQSLQIVGAGANLANDNYIESADNVYYQFVPDHPHLLEDFSAEADYVFDTFGAGTYANNPANALIYEVCLKSPDNRGCISMIASLVPGNKKYSTFGNLKTRKLITDFFKERMDVKVDIRPTYLESGINPGNIVSDLLIRAQRSGKDNKKFGLTEFKELSLELKEIIGTPVIKNTWANEDFKIHSYDYVHLDEESMSSVTDTEGSESVEVLETDEMPMTVLKSISNDN